MSSNDPTAEGTGRTTGNGTGSDGDFDWRWTKDDTEWVPPEIDTSRPSPARMYDFALGGKDNFAVDREAVERVGEIFPGYAEVALANRAFLTKAVAAIAEAGVRQFIDLGTGIPTSPNVHEVVRGFIDDMRIVYVDNDPIVMAHNRARRATVPGVITVQHDLRQPSSVLDDPEVRELIDFNEPIGLMFFAVLHFVRRDLAAEIVQQYVKALPSGSYLALSTACLEGMEPSLLARLEEVYADSPSQIVYRTRTEIEQLFEGFTMLEPGLTEVTRWRTEGTPLAIRMQAGVGRLDRDV